MENTEKDHSTKLDDSPKHIPKRKRTKKRTQKRKNSSSDSHASNHTSPLPIFSHFSFGTNSNVSFHRYENSNPEIISN